MEESKHHMQDPTRTIEVFGAFEHNLKGIDLKIERNAITVITGVSGSGKSSLAFDTVLAEAQRRFFYTLSHYTRQFLDMGSRPALRHISGLSPAIALAQNETQPSRRATVGTLTDISELLGVLYARFGETTCPKHGLPTAAQTPVEIAERLMAAARDKTIAICAPVAEAKKGNFAAPLTKFAERGYLKAFIDGKVVSLSPMPKLAREEKHTIKLIIDHVKIKPQSRDRLLRSIEAALAEGGGYGEYMLSGNEGQLDFALAGSFSAVGGCPSCGFSWPRLDSRYFSANSLGRCEDCHGFGVVVPAGYDEEGEGDEADEAGVQEALEARCPSCAGTGLKRDLTAIRLGQRSIIDLQTMPLSALVPFLEAVRAEERLRENPAFARVADEVLGGLKRTLEVGLGYLTLSRRVRTLSGGEAQRLKLAGILGESLRGVLYVLDEPSQGLHPSELDKLCEALVRLKAEGNTVIVVDHDEVLMRRADWIIDLGPGGGARGGQLMAKFRPGDAAQFQNQSLTARHLAHAERPAVVAKAVDGGSYLTIKKPRLHNLKMDEVKFKLHAMNVVTGVSGAGKSSLVMDTLFDNLLRVIEAEGQKTISWWHCQELCGAENVDAVWLIDRRPVAKSTVSMPASYLDVFTDLRNLYAELPDAQIAGLTARSFSLSAAGGRCEECRGRGEINLSMRFLADARVVCPVCKGRRYQAHIGDIKFSGLSMPEVLELTLDEVLEHFKNFRKIVRKLQPAVALGLGYLKLGQPSASLSGGEAQRLKLVPFLAKNHGKGSVLVVDEPTTGLHFEDVGRLAAALRRLVDQGATVVLVEHNTELALAADWLVELGPGAADAGGQLLYQGPPLGLLQVSGAPTAPYLRSLLPPPRPPKAARACLNP